MLAALGALALGVCVVVAVRTDDRTDGVVGPLPSPESPITVPVDMLVSPNGDLQPAAAIGSDGVTLDETDGVQISPKQQ